jgi:hypothetical protein
MSNQAAQHLDFDAYQPRNPQAGGYFRCVQDNFEELESLWDDRYASRYGFWRPYVMDVIYRYLECGDLHFGFARLRCDQCGHEYLLAYSCKRRHFCPSCHQKRVVQYGEWLLSDVLKRIPHRQWVFSIPKRLRIYFLLDRKLLANLSKCAFKVIRAYLAHAVPGDNAVPGASIAVQTYGDFLNFNPHLNALPLVLTPNHLPGIFGFKKTRFLSLRCSNDTVTGERWKDSRRAFVRINCDSCGPERLVLSAIDQWRHSSHVFPV